MFTLQEIFQKKTNIKALIPDERPHYDTMSANWIDEIYDTDDKGIRHLDTIVKNEYAIHSGPMVRRRETPRHIGATDSRTHRVAVSKFLLVILTLHLVRDEWH